MLTFELTLDAAAGGELSTWKQNAPGGIRTHGLRIRNPALYPTELRGLKKYQLLTVTFFSFRVKL